MGAATKECPVLDCLDPLPDEDLRRVIERARTLLAARATERRRQATAEIRRLAREHGLDVAVKQPGRKRGRPRKSGPAAL